MPLSERRRLANKSQSFCCEDCGMVASLLKPHNDTNSSEAEAAASEAKEIIKTMTLKVKLKEFSAWLKGQIGKSLFNEPF